ncbi:AEL084Wp [Eremothecium gossypii ATCC 10895]|uniref:Phosphatidate cytidylyltransferase n=1 Tax=Eremothecium gossypii (strain ATCC 10895 / CBS 109.51 / FGSC 9923 / NRRL Y-1056) TaxID=284811 RepID=Q757U6_EREGS|nr:AEL084Wp [Eremothecium gossypii ATCC 10895]AAS52601.1 AEL084Wp [Eremothecium gossypii ATCC 10895]
MTDKDSRKEDMGENLTSDGEVASVKDKVATNPNGDPRLLEDSKVYNFVVRTIWTLIMIAGFFITLAMGHFWCVILILGCQIATFQECIAVTAESGREKNLPLTRTLNWYFLFTTIYYLDGKSLYKLFRHYTINYRVLGFIAANHKFISYCMLVFGFVVFVCSLRKGFLKFQFASLCVTHMVLLLVVFQAHLIINNVLNGLIWFLLPCGLVIVNDIFAYLCGITFGRTKLIAISPKKTLEGFLGAWFFTGLAALVLTRLLTPYTYMTCPVQNIHTNVFSPLNCETNPVFIPQTYRLPPIIFDRFNVSTITFKPIYMHAFNLATFASLFAPFGGFFASGLKRTFKVKDFGHSIPGHGGITDRVDCQFMMGSFMNLYYETFISEKRITVETVLSTILMNFDERQILQLIAALNRVLWENGKMAGDNYERISELYNI